jgi:hypothetical protein
MEQRRCERPDLRCRRRPRRGGCPTRPCLNRPMRSCATATISTCAPSTAPTPPGTAAPARARGPRPGRRRRERRDLQGRRRRHRRPTRRGLPLQAPPLQREHAAPHHQLRGELHEAAARAARLASTDFLTDGEPSWTRAPWERLAWRSRPSVRSVSRRPWCTRRRAGRRAQPADRRRRLFRPGQRRAPARRLTGLRHPRHSLRWRDVRPCQALVRPGRRPLWTSLLLVVHVDRHERVVGLPPVNRLQVSSKGRSRPPEREYPQLRLTARRSAGGEPGFGS